jgi:3-dehydroquinate synthase
MTEVVQVELGARSYEVRVGDGELARVGRVVASLPGVTSVVVVTDTGVPEAYPAAVSASLGEAGFEPRTVAIPSGEEHKTLATCSEVYDRVLSTSPALDRHSVLVAVGGGVVGDVGGFVSATVLRGVRFVQVPTTLLAAVDASVGGKTGVDHVAGKNLIGAFHQPAGVVMDVATLRTLPLAEFRSGLAECVKHAMIADESLLEFLEQRSGEIAAIEPTTMVELVARNVQIKAGVVSADERESGIRAHLNFGHTVGHAIETSSGYGSLTHGQAVALGMRVNCRLAQRRGLIGGEVLDRLDGVLTCMGLELRRAGLQPADLWEIMLHDKKTRAGRVTVILPRGIGEVSIVSDVQADEMARALSVLE